MAIKKPVPQAPIREDGPFSTSWQRWFNLVSSNSVRIYDLTPTLTPTSVAANTTAEEIFTVTGVLATDILLTTIKPALTAGIGIVGSRVAGDNSIAITFINATAAPIVPPVEAYKFILIRN